MHDEQEDQAGDEAAGAGTTDLGLVVRRISPQSRSRFAPTESRRLGWMALAISIVIHVCLFGGALVALRLFYHFPVAQLFQSSSDGTERDRSVGGGTPPVVAPDPHLFFSRLQLMEGNEGHASVRFGPAPWAAVGSSSDESTPGLFNNASSLPFLILPQDEGAFLGLPEPQEGMHLMLARPAAVSGR